MLNVKIHKKGEKLHLRFRMGGSLGEILTDVSFLIYKVYKSLEPNAALAFRVSLIETLTQPDSPVFSGGKAPQNAMVVRVDKQELKKQMQEEGNPDA